MSMYEYNLIRLEKPAEGRDTIIAALSETSLWGVFGALFGLRNDERIIISRGSIRENIPQAYSLDTFAMTATARPTQFIPLQRPGVYVIRTFSIQPDHVDEFVELSQAAWQTFETDDEFAAAAQGLFRPERLQNGLVPMQLVTWYNHLSSWERSRNPDEQSSENFARRRLLTQSTSAIATRLVDFA